MQIGEYARAGAQDSIVADEREPAAGTEIELAVIARQARGVQRD